MMVGRLFAAIIAAVAVALCMSAGARASLYPGNYKIWDYELMDRFPTTGSQFEVCTKMGIPNCEAMKPIAEVCPMRYVENGSYLYKMSDTVRGVTKVNPDGTIFRMNLDPSDSRTSHWARVCNPFPNGWVFLRFEGCHNYVYTPSSWLKLRGEETPVAEAPPPSPAYYPPPAYSQVQQAEYEYPSYPYYSAPYYQAPSSLRAVITQQGAISQAYGGIATSTASSFARSAVYALPPRIVPTPPAPVTNGCARCVTTAGSWPVQPAIPPTAPHIGGFGGHITLPHAAPTRMCCTTTVGSQPMVPHIAPTAPHIGGFGGHITLGHH